MLSSPQLSTLIFSFFFSHFLFFLAILFYETKKRPAVRTHFTLFFSLRIGQSTDARQYLKKEKKKRKKNISCKTDESNEQIRLKKHFRRFIEKLKRKENTFNQGKSSAASSFSSNIFLFDSSRRIAVFGRSFVIS